MGTGRRQAAIAAGSAAAVAAGAEVLRAGGNAVDAAIASALAAGISEPGLASLGGGGFLISREPGADTNVLDFFVDAPGLGRQAATDPVMEAISIQFSGAVQVFHAGPASTAVPGALDGLVAAHERAGRLGFTDVVAPAARLARAGTPAEPMQAYILRLLSAIFTARPACRQVYAPAGRTPEAGELLSNPALAEVLDLMGRGAVRRIADLPSLAQLARDDTAGLAITELDVQRYRPRWRAALQVAHHGATITTNPAPSFGGPILLEATRLLNEAGRAGEDPQGMARVVRALHGATDREKRLRQQAPAAVRGTTHVSVVDGEGGVAALTQSNGSCSGVVVPETGIHLNNVMGEEDLHPHGLHQAPAGERIGSMMAPSLLDLPDGTVVAFGSGGSERIRSALVHIVVGLVDRGLTLAEAVHAPRLHWDAGTVQAEPPLSAEAEAVLVQLGPVTRWTSPDVYFGGTHVAARHPDGRVEAVGDPRRGGSSMVVDLTA